MLFALNNLINIIILAADAAAADDDDVNDDDDDDIKAINSNNNSNIAQRTYRAVASAAGDGSVSPPSQAWCRIRRRAVPGSYGWLPTARWARTSSGFRTCGREAP